MTSPGAQHFATELVAELAEVGVTITNEVALAAAEACFVGAQEACAKVLMAAGVPMNAKKGGRFGKNATPCVSYQVNGITILLG